MPTHDWTRVEAGIFHDFHTAWIGELRSALNEGLLPEGYYALAEQHAGRGIADVLTLQAPTNAAGQIPWSTPKGGTAVAEAPPKVRRRETVEQTGLSALRRSLAIRHVSGHRLVALLEIVSPANKDRRQHVDAFAAKAIEALRTGVHLLMVDLFPPSQYDPHGMHGIIRQLLEDSDETYDLPADEPLTLASYSAGTAIEIYLEHLAPGATLAEMPLFLESDRYVGAPLESTYMAAYRGMPAFWRNVLEERPQVS
jgi:8-oxo-dGTP pyrophosphatase MutT (NUDIX family)